MCTTGLDCRLVGSGHVHDMIITPINALVLLRVDFYYIWLLFLWVDFYYSTTSHNSGVSHIYSEHVICCYEYLGTFTWKPKIFDTWPDRCEPSHKNRRERTYAPHHPLPPMCDPCPPPSTSALLCFPFLFAICRPCPFSYSPMPPSPPLPSTLRWA
jgi:hypothetical protein